MSKTIEIVVPELDTAERNPFVPAPRGSTRDTMSLVIINNGRPRASEMLEELATLVAEYSSVSEFEVITKVSSSRPLSIESVTEISTRFDLAIAGVGD